MIEEKKQDAIATKVEAMAEKYSNAQESVSPAEVVADLTTILEGDDEPN